MGDIKSIENIDGVFVFTFANGHRISVPVAPNMSAQTARCHATVGPPLPVQNPEDAYGLLHLDLLTSTVYIHTGHEWHVLAYPKRAPGPRSQITPGHFYCGYQPPHALDASDSATAGAPGTLYLDISNGFLHLRTNDGSWVRMYQRS